MLSKRLGRQTVRLGEPVSVVSFANIGGKQEAEGPLSSYFDELSDDSFFGEKTWEKAESAMQKKVLQRALDQAKLKPRDLDYIFAGDLLNQCIGSSFGLRDFGPNFPLPPPPPSNLHRRPLLPSSLLLPNPQRIPPCSRPVQSDNELTPTR